MFSESDFGAIDFGGSGVMAGPAGFLSIDQKTIVLKALGLTKYGSRINPIVIGDGRQIARIYQGLPDAGIVSKAYLTIKKKLKDSDAVALAHLPITEVESDTGVIFQPDLSLGNLECRFNLLPAHTLRAKIGIQYFFDVQVTFGGIPYTLEVGSLPFSKGVTAAAV